MIDSKILYSILNALESTDNAFKINIDKLIKVSVKFANKTKEFQEDLRLYGDMLFHVYIYDIDFNIWINSVDGELTYNHSFYEQDTEEIRTIHFILTKKIIRKIFKQEIDPSDAYIKGLINIEGNISDAIITKNLIKSYFLYLKHFIKKN